MQNSSCEDRNYESFVAILRHYGIYKPENRYKIVCPFHGDINPSLEINQQKKFWYCYGCGRHGSTIELIKEFHLLEHKKPISDLQAQLQLKKLTGNIIYNNIYNINNTSIVDKVNDITYSDGIRIAKDYYFNLPSTCWYRPEGEEEIIAIRKYMNKRGFKNRTLTKAEAKATYNKLYPICFPIYDNGIFRGYVMRTMDPEVEQKRKYMYNKGFKRERTLAGEYTAPYVVLVEGFLDKVKANQIGLKNVAAILGWKITQTQLRKLQKRKIKLVLCALDNDECGNKGYRYLKMVAKTYGFKVKRIHYPKGTKDMGDITPENQHIVINQVKKYL